MWTEHTPGTPLEGREVFTMPRDINPKAQSNHGHSRATLTVNPKQAALMLVNVTWPPSDRGTVKDFYRAVGQRKTTLPGFHPGARFGTMTAKVDFVRRILFIKNLKAGSSTVGTLIDPERKADEFRTKHMNQTAEMLLQCMDIGRNILYISLRQRPLHTGGVVALRVRGSVLHRSCHGEQGQSKPEPAFPQPGAQSLQIVDLVRRV